MSSRRELGPSVTLLGMDETLAALGLAVSEVREDGPVYLEALAVRITNLCKAYSPVETGRLRAGWQSRPADESTPVEPVVWIGNEVEYAAAVEYGHMTGGDTDPGAEHDHSRSDNELHDVKDVPPHPMLRAALTEVRVNLLGENLDVLVHGLRKAG